MRKGNGKGKKSSEEWERAGKKEKCGTEGR